MSRAKKYEKEYLLGILYEYLEKKKGQYRQIMLKDIAEYAKTELNEEGIRYYHFSRNKDVKEEIDRINTALCSPNKFYRYEFRDNLRLDVEAMVDRCTGNEQKLYEEVSALVKRSSTMADQLTNLSEENKKLTDENDNIKKVNKEKDQIIKNLKSDNQKLYKAISEERQKQLRGILVAYHMIEGEGDEEEFERTLSDKNGGDMAEVIDFFKRRG